MYHNMFGGGMWFSWLFWIIIIALIAWLVMSMVNRSQKNQVPALRKKVLSIF